MIVRNIRTEESNIDPRRSRLCADIVCPSLYGKPETCWFDLPETLAPYSTQSADPWLIAFLPLAMNLNENLQIEGLIDRQLYENVHDYMLITQNWFPQQKLITIDAGMVDSSNGEGGGVVASFFSGGADAFFTALRHRLPGMGTPGLKIDDLIFVWGFDIPLSNRDAFDNYVPKLRSIAAELDCQLMDIATNLRELIPERLVPWGPVGHGPALAAVATSTTKYRKTLIGSEGYGMDVFPWGTHPITDHLLSTSTTEMVHDGVIFKRTQKLEAIASFEVVQKHLRVCWRSCSEHNCCECEKCYRTMATLDALGELSKFRCFDTSKFSHRSLRRVLLSGEWYSNYYNEIRQLAISRQRVDTASAIRSAIFRSRIKRILLAIADWGQNRRLFWRFSDFLRSTVYLRSLS